jgi:ADP-heptose:LPS heptosyltransferase
MQTIDRYAGQLVCFLLSFLYRKNAAPPKGVKKILVIKMFGMGSIVLMTPMLRALKKQNPGYALSFVTLAENSRIPSLYGIADAVYPVRRGSFGVFFWDTCKTILLLRIKGVDISVDAEFFSRYTAVFCFLVGARYRIGFYSRDIYRGNLIDYRAYFNPYRHMIENFNELTASFLTGAPETASSYPSIDPRVRERVCDELRSRLDDSSRPLVLINPNVSDTSSAIDRSWPANHFIKLADFLLKKGYGVAITGSHSQKEKAETIARQCGNGAISVAGMVDVEGLLALMQQSFLLITNDSGPLHLAVSMDLPTFSFFGTESPIMYGHRSPIHHLFFKSLACSPCLSVFNFKRGKCEFGSKCLRLISTEEVIARFNEVEPVLTQQYVARTKQIPAS